MAHCRVERTLGLNVWRKYAFAWEYKGKHRDLDAAHAQLLRYAVALENPPLLIVPDMDRIVIRTNWTNTVQETHTLLLDDLRDGAKRGLLRALRRPRTAEAEQDPRRAHRRGRPTLRCPRPAPARARPPA